jgi:hypothetical protein
MESTFFMNATGRHVGHRLAILNIEFSNGGNLQHKTLQPEGINTYGIVLANDTFGWTQMATYHLCALLAGRAQGICIKPTFPYLLSKHFHLSN